MSWKDKEALQEDSSPPCNEICQSNLGSIFTTGVISNLVIVPGSAHDKTHLAELKQLFTSWLRHTRIYSPHSNIGVRAINSFAAWETIIVIEILFQYGTVREKNELFKTTLSGTYTIGSWVMTIQQYVGVNNLHFEYTKHHGWASRSNRGKGKWL